VRRRMDGRRGKERTGMEWRRPKGCEEREKVLDGRRRKYWSRGKDGMDKRTGKGREKRERTGRKRKSEEGGKIGGK
jgi:hypothetical protein